MKSIPDSTIHQNRENQFIEHVQRLLTDSRLRVDTLRGRRPVTELIRDVTATDRGVELKRLMSEMNLPDRQLQSRMPVGRTLDVVLSRRKWWGGKQAVGRLRVVCVSPAKSLLAGEPVNPTASQDVQRLLSETPGAEMPTTVVLMSSSGFAPEAHELADRRVDRTVILVEPNDAGGWNVLGPVQTKALADLFDPETDEAKRARLRECIQSKRAEVMDSGLAADRVALWTQLPLPWVEQELKSYAKANAGLTARRLDGRIVLFREGALPAQSEQGGEMSFVQRVKTLFARKGETEKKIAFLSERRAKLGQQRDLAYDDLGAMERQESDLREQFKRSDTP